MRVVYAPEKAPTTLTKSLFLAGPSPREAGHENWRVEAIRYLREDLKYDGTVFVPIPRDGKWPENYGDQVEWEDKCLHMADIVVVWLPRDLDTLPGFTTNVEFGLWVQSGKLMYGRPDGAPKTRYLDWHAEQEGIVTYNDLHVLLADTVEKQGKGAKRTGGEREVPLFIWKTEHFQSWYKATMNAGNRLDGAKVVWTFRVGPTKSFVFFWALHVNVYIEAEDRHKTNEVVLARPDISTIVAYHQPNYDHPTRDTPLEDILDIKVALIREFRSPAVTPDGCVRELPGGSSWTPGQDPQQVAADELKEETGVAIEAVRFHRVDSRQLVGTLSSHFAHVFSVELREDEWAEIEAEVGQVHGVEEDTERTYVEVTTVRDLLRPSNVDWSMVGMVMAAVLQPEILKSPAFFTYEADPIAIFNPHGMRREKE